MNDLNKKDYTVAENYFNSAIKLIGDSQLSSKDKKDKALAYALLGIVNFKKNLLDETKEQFEKAIDLLAKLSEEEKDSQLSEEEKDSQTKLRLELIKKLANESDKDEIERTIMNFMSKI